MLKLLPLFFFSLAPMLLATPFADIQPGHWAYRSVTSLVESGVIQADPNSGFSGGGSVSRFDLSLMLAAAIKSISSPEFHDLSPENRDAMQKLAAEFAEELLLLGIRSEIIASELKNTGEELTRIKVRLATIEDQPFRSGNMTLSCDLRQRFEDFSYPEKRLDALYNNNRFTTRVGLNMNMAFDPDVSAFVRLETHSFWNTAGGDWTGGRITGTGTDSTMSAHLAYARVKNPFGLAREVRIGRQRFTLGRITMRGVADGIGVDKHFSRDSHLVFRNGALKYSHINPDAATDSDGLDLIYSAFDWNAGILSVDGYAINGRDPLERFRANGRSAHRINWYGLGATGKITRSLMIEGELCASRWDEKFNIDNDPDPERGGWASFASVRWLGRSNTALCLKYMLFDELFFRPAVWDNDSFLDQDEDSIHTSAGYESGFECLAAELSRSFTDIDHLTLRLESITDRMPYPSGIPGDDRTVYTGMYRRDYRQDISFTLLYRLIDANPNSAAGQVAAGKVRGTDGNGFGNVSACTDAYSNGWVSAVSDVSLLRLEMSLRF
ncbi:MAG: S-layer homology domain-containing protein [Candidatus Wallbacteria bacterium]|nr:S-layer homology domain-containing protein [Candidatus Wallbacteria bacterium]